MKEHVAERDESAKEQLRQDELLVCTRQLRKTSSGSGLDPNVGPRFKNDKNIAASFKKL